MQTRYRLTNAGKFSSARTYTIYIEDDYVVRCEPTYRPYLGMKLDTLMFWANSYGDTIEKMEENEDKIYLITYFTVSGGRNHMEIVGKDEDSAVAEFLKVCDQKPIRIYERVGIVEEVNVPTYKVKKV